MRILVKPGPCRRGPRSPGTCRESRRVAAVPRSRRRRRRRRRVAARTLVDDRERRVGRRSARPRLVVADRLARPRVRDVRGQPRRVQGAVHRHLRQRLRRGAREAGAVRGRDRQARGRARHRAHERERRDQLHGLALDAKTGKVLWEQRGAQGRAVRRPPPQEHLRVGDAGHRRRAALCLVRRQRRRVLLLARRHAALEARRGRRSRSTSTSARRRRRSCTADASTSCTTTTASRSSPRSTRRPASELWTVKRDRPGARSTSGWATPFVWDERARTEIVTIGRGFVISYDLDGRELWRLKGMTQATPSPVAADGLLYVGSGSQGEANRPLFAVRPGRERRHLAGEGCRRATSSSPGCSRASRATRRRRSSIAAASMP